MIETRKERRPIQGVLAAVAGSLVLAALPGYVAPAIEDVPDYAYLIVKASVLQQDRAQPDWMYLCRSTAQCEHFDASGPILKLEPGEYQVHHVDFGKSFIDPIDSLYIRAEGIQLEAGFIYFYGHIQVDRSHSRVERREDWASGPDRRQNHYETQVLMDTELARTACDWDPGIFDKYLVVIVQSGDKVRLNCNAGDG